jgi:hypothetical protein
VLDTVGDYVSEARVLLQDTMEPYRTPSTELKTAIGLGILEMRRLRPDLFTFTALPAISSISADNMAVAVEPTHRLPLLYFIVGHVGLKDEEEGAEGRANGFLGAFRKSMLSLAG